MELGKIDLLNAIMAEAQANADRIVAEAEATAAENGRLAQSEMQAYLEDSAARDAADSADIIARRKVAAGMEGKKAVLAAKRELMQAVSDRMVERLYALPRAEYLRLVELLLEKYAAEGDSVYIAKDCAVTFGDVQSLDVCRRLTLKVDYDARVKSGVLLSGVAVDKDLSFEALAEDVFRRNEMELAARLFGN